MVRIDLQRLAVVPGGQGSLVQLLVYCATFGVSPRTLAGYALLPQFDRAVQVDRRAGQAAPREWRWARRT